MDLQPTQTNHPAFDSFLDAQIHNGNPIALINNIIEADFPEEVEEVKKALSDEAIFLQGSLLMNLYTAATLLRHNGELIKEKAEEPNWLADNLEEFLKEAFPEIYTKQLKAHEDKNKDKLVYAFVASIILQLMRQNKKINIEYKKLLMQNLSLSGCIPETIGDEGKNEQ